jgi:hypothetical protein
MDSADSGHVLAASSFEYGSESSASIGRGEFPTSA